MAVNHLEGNGTERKAKTRGGAVYASTTITAGIPLFLADGYGKTPTSCVEVMDAMLIARNEARRDISHLRVLFEWPEIDLESNVDVVLPSVTVQTPARIASVNQRIKRALETQRQVWRWCLANNVARIPLVKHRPPRMLFDDPWLGIAETVKHWHLAAASVRDLCTLPQSQLVAVLSPWSASSRGLQYSFRYVEAAKVRAIAIHFGKDCPYSQNYLVGKAQFTMVIE